MLKKKPIIISAGCSFTDRFFKSMIETLPEEKRGGWLIWTDYFKDKLEKQHNEKYEIIHTGSSGAGQDFALDKIVKNIVVHKDKIKFVLWGGTGWERWMEPISHTRINPTSSVKTSRPMVNNKGVNIPKENDPFDERGLLNDAATAVVFKYYCRKHGRKNVIDRSFRQLWTVFKLCEQYNITLIYYQLLNPMQDMDNNMIGEFKKLLDEEDELKLGIDFNANAKWEMSEAAVTSPWFKDLLKNKKHFYGLKYLDPMAKHWGWEAKSAGVHDELVVAPFIETSMKLNEMERDDWGQPVGVDLHPNAEGQKDIAERIWKHYETNFL